MLHVALFYSIPLTKFYFYADTFHFSLHYFTALYFYALFSSFRVFSILLVYFVHIQDLSTFSLLYALFYLLCSIFTPLIFRLLCIASFLYITPFRFTSFRIALCFPYFSWSSFRSGFNFTSSWNVARPSIPCSTCFIEPRSILLPLIPLCPSRVNPGLWRNPSRIDGAM